jgi:hypothetical protein
LAQQASIIAAIWGFNSRGISSLFPLKPTAATTYRTVHICKYCSNDQRENITLEITLEKNWCKEKEIDLEDITDLI